MLIKTKWRASLQICMSIFIFFFNIYRCATVTENIYAWYCVVFNNMNCQFGLTTKDDNNGWNKCFGWIQYLYCYKHHKNKQTLRCLGVVLIEFVFVDVHVDARIYTALQLMLFQTFAKTLYWRQWKYQNKPWCKFHLNFTYSHHCQAGI